MRPQSGIFLTLLVSLLASAGAIADAERLYLEEGGIVLFEVEDIEPAAGWQLKTDIDGYDGNGYFEWTGPNAFPVSSAGLGTTTYRFRIETAGNYQFRWRSYIAIGESNTEHNDSWVRFTTGEDIPEQHPLDGWTKVYMNNSNSWSWSSNTVDHVGEPIRQYFAQGDHIVEISGRSNGHAIDRIALYRYDDVPYNTSVVNTWELSKVLLSDGSVVTQLEESESTECVEDATETGDSNSAGDTDDTVTNDGTEGTESTEGTEGTEDTGCTEQPETTDPETTDPETSRPIALENLSVASENWRDVLPNQCVGNTLAIPALSSAYFEPASGDIDYQTGLYVKVGDAGTVALFKFDTSLVPPIIVSTLEYTTGETESNGRITYSLGSHSDWNTSAQTSGSYPHTLTELGQTAGGWQPLTRYQSAIAAELLNNSSISTIVISNTFDSEPLHIFSELSSDLVPRLILTGDDGFCDIWQSNVDAANVVPEPPAEINEVADEEIEFEIETNSEANIEVTSEFPERNSDNDGPNETSDSRSGGSLSWLLLFILATGYSFRFSSN